MKSLILHLAIPLLILCLTASQCQDEGIDDDEDIVSPQPPVDLPEGMARRTVLMYTVAQNSLGYNNPYVNDSLDYQQLDSIEMVAGCKYINDYDRLLVYVDDERSPRLYRYSKESTHGPELVGSWHVDINSSSPDILRQVLSWTKEHYPSQEYGLVLWSHSDGWLPSTNKDYLPTSSFNQPSLLSFGIDVGESGNLAGNKDEFQRIGAQMDIDDMAQAIANSGIYLKYIFFDSCLMQNIECAYSLRNVTDFIIAGPMQIPACGANYTNMIKKGLFTNAEIDIVDTYVKDAIEGFYDTNSDYYDMGVVMSSLRTDKIEELAQTLADLLPHSLLTNRQTIDLEAKGVLNYQNYCRKYYYHPHNFDAQEAMRQLLSETDFQQFKTALDATIVRKGTAEQFWIGPYTHDMQSVDSTRYCGVSMFIPQLIYTSNAPSCYLYGDLNLRFQETLWYKAAGWSTIGW